MAPTTPPSALDRILSGCNLSDAALRSVGVHPSPNTTAIREAAKAAPKPARARAATVTVSQAHSRPNGHIPPAPCTATLTERDLEMFRRIGVGPDLLAEAHIEQVSDRDARERFGIRGSGDMSGIAFPYYSHITGQRTTARVRRANPEFEDDRPKNKYISAWGDGRHLYFPPDAGSKLQELCTPIVLVEAEKSVLAITAWAQRTSTDLLAVGTGGCWSWRGRKGKTESASGERVDVTGPLPDLAVCNDRKVYVCLDANAATNPKVQAAQAALVRELSERNCKVFICAVPAVEGVNGPDDLIGARGDEALAQVLANAKPAGDAIEKCEFGEGEFQVSARGVFFISKPDEEGNAKPPIWICGLTRVTAKTRDDKSGSWGRFLEWEDGDRVQHAWAMPDELLQRDGGVEARCELARQGLSISPTKRARDLLASYLQVWPQDARARCVDRLGWYGASYILPSESIGETGERIVFQNSHAIEPALSVSGTVAEWRANNATLARNNSRMVFGICTSLAGPLLEPAGEDSGGFHFLSQSSTGKTTTLRLSASVWGNPARYCRAWRVTVNGLEGLAALHNDGLLILDELGQLDPREAGESCYLLANGRGKARASRTGAARQSASWRLLFLSAGEESLSALMNRAGKKPTAGQEIRLAEIGADAGAEMGAFEELHGCENGAALALAIKDVASKYHGAVGAEWLRLLVNDRSKLGTVLPDGIRRFVAEFAPDGASGQVERVARRFGLVAVAGEIATRYGLTGWDKGEASAAVGKCFRSWLESFGATGNREERALLAQVRAFFETNGASRFQDALAENPNAVINRAGFFRTDTDNRREFLVLPEAFKREICAGFDPKYGTRILREHGWLLAGGDKTAQRIRLPGMGPTRVYVFGPKVWEGDE